MTKNSSRCSFFFYYLVAYVKEQIKNNIYFLKTKSWGKRYYKKKKKIHGIIHIQVAKMKAQDKQTYIKGLHTLAS